jgi:hypothetical protein
MTASKKTHSPSTLAKTGKKAGIELTEGQLGQVAGGFLKIDGVEGESADSKHKGEIEALSYSIPVAPPTRLK